MPAGTDKNSPGTASPWRVRVDLDSEPAPRFREERNPGTLLPGLDGLKITIEGEVAN
jgi:hypothetical protein